MLRFLEGRNVLNYFYFNINEGSPEDIQGVFSNKKLTFLFTLNETGQLVVGIENPFSQMENFSEENQALMKTLENLLSQLVDEVSDVVERKIHAVNKKLIFSEEELKDIIRQTFISPDLKPKTSNNKALLEFVASNKDIYMFINKQLQLGHPSLVFQADKNAEIGGELKYINGVWVINNKSGRFGWPEKSTAPIPEILSQIADRLVTCMEILKSKGVGDIRMLFREGVPPEAKEVIALANEVLIHYYTSGQVEINEEKLAKVFEGKDEQNEFEDILNKIIKRIDQLGEGKRTIPRAQ